MEIIKTGIAGTLESSDLMVTVEIGKSEGIELELKSTVQQQFGKEIKEIVLMILKELGINSCKITLEDKGALDCTIIARLKTAVYRACNMNEYGWEA